MINTQMSDYKTFLDNGIEEINQGHFEKGIEWINKSLELKDDWEIPYFSFLPQASSPFQYFFL